MQDIFDPEKRLAILKAEMDVSKRAYLKRLQQEEKGYRVIVDEEKDQEVLNLLTNFAAESVAALGNILKSGELEKINVTTDQIALIDIFVNSFFETKFEETVFRRLTHNKRPFLQKVSQLKFTEQFDLEYVASFPVKNFPAPEFSVYGRIFKKLAPAIRFIALPETIDSEQILRKGFNLPLVIGKSVHNFTIDKDQKGFVHKQQTTERGTLATWTKYFKWVGQMPFGTIDLYASNSLQDQYLVQK